MSAPLIAAEIRLIVIAAAISQAMLISSNQMPAITATTTAQIKLLMSPTESSLSSSQRIFEEES